MSDEEDADAKQETVAPVVVKKWPKKKATKNERGDYIIEKIDFEVKET